MQKTRIVVPCYNESKRLNPKAFIDALEDDCNLNFLFVDDGSTDNTSNILGYMKNVNPAQVEFVILEKNRGKAEAVRLGILKSIQEKFDCVGYWDADLATPLDTIGTFCRLLNSGAPDIVIGSRVRLLGRKVERKAVRHYLGRAFATCASLLLGISIYDSQCGAKLFRNSDLLKLVFAKPFKVNWIFDVEIFARFLVVSNASPTEISSKWIEYPLYEWNDVKGSKVKIRDFIKSGFELMALFFYLKTPLRNLYQKYILGEGQISDAYLP